MILVDAALRRRAAEGRPIRVGMLGAGFMARGVARQIINFVPGMTLAAIANRTVAKAISCYVDAGTQPPRVVASAGDLADAIDSQQPAVSEDALLLCRSPQIDAIIDVTGDVEFGARCAVEAIAHQKHLILMNAELDATLGSLLKHRADQAGVIVTGCDGDQPAVQMNLYRFVRSLGLTPLVCGNIKGLHDPYRNPTTQASFARQWGQNPSMVTSFADGSKISVEQALVANATGLRVPQRGMFGRRHDDHIDSATKLYHIDQLRSMGGIVDYLIGARPSPGVYVFATIDDPQQRHYLKLYKLGDGPLYSFYQPYHLCHFEAPMSIARAVLFHDAAIAPIGPPVVDVITVAKVPMQAGQVLDGIGHYLTYGLAEHADKARHDRLLPLGLAEGCRLKRNLERDQVITYDDVEPPADRLSWALRAEQDAMFPLA